MKRKICKRCKYILIPGSTAEVKITGKDNVCEIKCNFCGAVKIFMIDPAYKMWLDNPESIVETITVPELATTESDQCQPVPLQSTSTQADQYKIIKVGVFALDSDCQLKIFY